MPNIPTYEGGEDIKITPPQGAAERYQQAARVAGQLGREGATELGRGIRTGAEEFTQGVDIFKRHETHIQRQQLAQQYTALETDYDEAMTKAAATTSPEGMSAAIGGVRNQFQARLAGIANNSDLFDENREYTANETRDITMRMHRREIVESSIAGGRAIENQAHNALLSFGKTIQNNPTVSGIDTGLAAWDRFVTTMKGSPFYEELNSETRARIDAGLDKQRADLVNRGMEVATLSHPESAAMMRKYYAGQFSPDAEPGLIELEQRETRQAQQLQMEKTRFGWQAQEFREHEATKQAQNRYDYWVQQAQLDPVTHLPTFTPDQLEAIHRDPALDGERRDNLFRNAAQAALSGSRAEDSPSVINDLQRRALLPDNNPEHLTADELQRVPLAGPGSISTQRHQELTGIINGQSFSSVEREQLAPAQQAITNMFPGGMTPQSAFAISQAQEAQIQFVLNAKRTGVSVADAIKQWNQQFPTADKIKETYGNPLPSAVDAARAPLTESQKIGAGIAAQASRMADMLQHGASPQTIADLLDRASGGKAKIPPEDIASGKWCADFVDAVLGSYNISGAGRTAASLRTWGNPVVPDQAKAGDVAVAPPSQGATGHAMIVLGAPAMYHGVYSVRVASTHLRGAPDNPGGVEWRPVAGLVFRSYQASLPESFNPDQKGNGQVIPPSGEPDYYRGYFYQPEKLLNPGGA